MVQTNEDAFEIKLALLNVAMLQKHIFEQNLLLRNKSPQIQVQRSDILVEFLFCLFKRHENAALFIIGRTIDQKIKPEQGFSGPSASRDQRGSIFWQAPSCN